MGEGALGIIEERVRKREEYLEGARGFAECVLRRLSNSTIIVYGSVARGDYNEWSDVDVLIITADEIPTKPVERLETLYECLKNNPLIEPVVITHQEFSEELDMQIAKLKNLAHLQTLPNQLLLNQSYLERRHLLQDIAKLLTQLLRLNTLMKLPNQVLNELYLPFFSI